MRLAIVVISMTFSTVTMAATYSCSSVKDVNEKAVLTIKSAKYAHWSNKSRSEDSLAVFTNIETAPYSSLKNERQYRLTDFYTDPDSAFYLSLPSNINQFPKRIITTIYFNNDDHLDEETTFLCVKR